MASDKSGNSSWWSSSWNSLVQTAKEKSMNAFELIKNDMVEFGTTMSNDISQVSTQIQDNSFIETVKTLAPQISSKQNNSSSTTITNHPSNKHENKLKNSSQNKTYDRFQTELLTLQNNQETYLNDPTNNLNEYHEWKDSFVNIEDSNKGIISNLLIENSVMRSLYSQLVPAQISNKEFWSRYFFKAKLIEDENRKRTNLIEKATSQVNENSYEKMSWDEDGEEEWSKIDKKEEQIVEKVKTEEILIENKDEKEESKIVVNNQESVATPSNDDDKKLEDSDEWEKDFEEDTSSEKNTVLSNVAEIVKEKYSSEENSKNVVMASNEETEKETKVKEEKNDDWESWD